MNVMTLKDFRLYHTHVHELCFIREYGYIACVCYIDNEDLFIYSIPENLRNSCVVNNYIDELTTDQGKILVHYVDIKRE